MLSQEWKARFEPKPSDPFEFSFNNKDKPQFLNCMDENSDSNNTDLPKIELKKRLVSPPQN